MTKASPKACPFCFGKPYYYKTRNGLLRHVMNSHMYDGRHRIVYVPIGKPKLIRIDTAIGAKFEEVSGWDEVEDFLIDYVARFKNPSKRSSRFWQYVDGN